MRGPLSASPLESAPPPAPRLGAAPQRPVALRWGGAADAREADLRAFDAVMTAATLYALFGSDVWRAADPPKQTDKVCVLLGR